MKILCTLIFILFSCWFAEGQSAKVLTADEVNKLLPFNLKGYSSRKNPKAVEMKLGDLKYAMCERTFGRKSDEVKMLLFDYAEAKIMLDQSIRKWNEMNPVDNDSVYFGSA